MLTEADILKLFNQLNKELEKKDIQGELYLVGGAVMCLVFKARPSTKDVDATFKPVKQMREAASQVATYLGLSEDWLNDAVKGYLSQQSNFSNYLELSHLKVYVALPEYLLAMKCLAMRIGEEFHDMEDVRFLLRYLNITNYPKALEVIKKYYPLKQFPQKTLYALEEMLEK